MRGATPTFMDRRAYRHLYGTTALKRRLLETLERFFEGDQQRIGHAKQVLRFAEILLEKERDTDAHIVVAAAILHDVGIKAAEEKYGSSAARLQEEEGPPIAKKMLLNLGFKIENIDEICDTRAGYCRSRLQRAIVP